MTLNYVTLTGTLPRAGGGLVTFTPSNWLTDAADALLIPPAPEQVTLSPAGGFSVKLLATDNSSPAPSGWYWTVTISGIECVAASSFSFFLAYAGGATQDISSLATVPSPVPVTAYLPVPSGTPSAGQVPVATGSGQASAWGPADAGGLLAANNLSDLNSAPAARTNLGLGTAATQASSAFDAAGAAVTAQSNAESFATSAVATETSRAEAAEALLAPLASPAFTGNQPTFTTAGGLALTAQGAQASITSPVSITDTNPHTLASMSIPANDPVAGAIYRIRCFGYFTTDATSANVTVALLWGATSLGSVIVSPQASLTAATWDLEGIVTFVTASACNAILTYKHSTAVANGWAANTNEPNSGTSATAVTVSSGQSLILQATVANNTHVSAWVCVGSIPERVW